MQVTVQLGATLPVKITKRKRWILASCSIFDIHAQGDTIEEAKKNLTEALTLFFISCFERGTLETVLKECGFRAVLPSRVESKKPIAEQDDYINVPIPFLLGQVGNACHA